MKKFLTIVAVTAFLTSCGGSSTTELVTTDSTNVVCDSTKCDSTKCETPTVVDTTKAAE
jgi:hypothetical protein